MEPHTQTKLPKALLSGAAMALVAGMLMGAAMKPDLNTADRPEGPQIFAGWSGERSTGPFDDAPTMASYRGEVPEYVVGTDWKREIAWRDDDAGADLQGAADANTAASDVADTQVVYRPAVFQDAPAPKVTYPSMAGGASYAAETPLPPAPPPAAKPQPTFDIEAPPEATGDTTIATHVDG